jgi:pimeloyl-ACP methyl ester carboxylesterase
METLDGIEIRHERVTGYGGVGLHVVRAGPDRGVPVVLLHGFPEHWISWRRQIPALARAGFAVLAPDLRGYHLSDKPAAPDAYRLRALVEDVAALVRDTGQPKAHVVGHDWGGIVAWTFAGEHPELLDRLVILNAPHLRLYVGKAWRPPQLLKSWYVLFFRLPGLSERALSAGDFAAVRRMFRDLPTRPDAFTAADIDEYVAALSRSGSLTAGLNYYRANLTPARLRIARAARTDAETLVLWGDRDPALGVELLEGIERVAPRARVRRLPGVGHWVQNEAPAAVNRALIGFLRG